MLKQTTSFFVLFLFLTSLMFAQGKYQVKEVDEETINPKENLQFTKNLPAKTLQGTPVINTSYDYPANAIVGDMIDLYDKGGDGTMDPYITAMQLLSSNEGGNRYTVVGYETALGWNAVSAYPTDMNVGWGNIQIATEGPLAGKALLFSHAPIMSSTFDLETNEATANVENPLPAGDFYPRFTYNNNGNVYVTGNDTAGAFMIWKSTDGLGNWSQVGPVGGDDFYGTLWTEVGIESNPSTGYVASVFRANRAGDMFLDGTPQDSAHVDYMYYTEDGENWTGEVIGYSGMAGQVANRGDNYRPQTYYWFQKETAIDNNNTVHSVFNGYSVNAEDSSDIWAVYYHNNNLDKYYAVSSEAVELEDDAAMGTYPGNSIGQSFPSVATSEDGQIVFVAWQGPEYTGEVGNSSIAMYPGDGSDIAYETFYTDIYYSYSTDGGETWEETQQVLVEDQKETAEYYPNLADQLVVDAENGEATAHFVYFYDELPGVSLFDENGASEGNQWLYDSFTFNVSVGVDDEEAVVKDYKLGQNYPNPFNPSTSIEFAIPQKENVSIKVYDMLGKEVATVVDKEMASGSHDVQFNAENLSSGMYLYTIKAGNFTQTKKMMLLK